MAKIDLNPDNYKSTFWGRFAESFYEEREGNEVWRQIIVRQNRTDIGLQDVKSSNPECRFITDGSCAYKDLWHMHQNLWATNTKGSPLHKFLQSLKEHGRITLTDPAQLKGHNFEFEDYKTEDWHNKKTGEDVKGRQYFLIAGTELDIDEADKHPTVAANNGTTDLPFDAPANGNNAGETAISPADSVLYETFAKYADGKNDAEIKQGLIIRQEVPEITNSPNLRVNIMNNVVTNQLLEMQILLKGEDGRYKYTLA